MILFFKFLSYVHSHNTFVFLKPLAWLCTVCLQFKLPFQVSLNEANSIEAMVPEQLEAFFVFHMLSFKNWPKVSTYVYMYAAELI